MSLTMSHMNKPPFGSARSVRLSSQAEGQKIRVGRAHMSVRLGVHIYDNAIIHNESRRHHHDGNHKTRKESYKRWENDKKTGRVGGAVPMIA